jgi:CRP-like cAMP-binding protein
MADDKLDECLGSSNQQRCSVLMLIREEFAKI